MAKRAALAFCLLAISLQATAAPAAPDFSRAQSLLREGRAAEAHEMLQRFEADLSGDPDYDYWLGVSALEAGRPAQASIALERALIVNPEFVGARVDLGRAYFALGDYERARLEFRTVLEQNPPPAAREVVERYLGEADALARSRARRWTAYLEASYGYDSNVNNSTSTGSVFVPLFGLNFALAPTSLRTPDGFFGLGAGGEATLPLSAGASVYAGADYRQRINFQDKDFDTASFGGRIGLQYAAGRNVYRAGVGYGEYDLDHRKNYDVYGATVEWRHAFDEYNAGNLLGYYNRVRFPDPALAGNNAEQTLVGVGWARALTARKTTIVFANATFGRENDTNSRVDGQRRIWGLRLAGQHGVRADLDAYASLGAQMSDYDTENFVFQDTRRDRYYEAVLGLLWRLRGEWSLRPQVAYVRNDSNIAIYEYDRYEFTVTLRYDFR